MPFTKVKWVQLPREIYGGHRVIEKIGEMCSRLGLRGIAGMVTGAKTYSVAGKTVEEILSEKYEVQNITVGQASKENLDKVENFLKEIRANFVVGVGGGSKIDLAKKASYDLGIPFISVPTTASHDGIASPRATIKNDDGISLSLNAAMPVGIVADTSVILTAPYRYLAAGVGDLVGNTTAIRDWELAHKLRNEDFSSSAYELSKYAAQSVISSVDYIKPGIEDSVWMVLKPLIVSGMAMSIAGTSRPASGSEHLFAHALEHLAPGKALHGELVGLGTIMMMYLHGGDWRKIRSVLRKVGAPVTAKQIGVDEDLIIEALLMAHKVRDRYTILGESGLTREAAEKLVRVTEVV